MYSHTINTIKTVKVKNNARANKDSLLRTWLYTVYVN